MLVTPLYAAILGFILVALSLRTIWLRRQLKIGVGDDHPVLKRAIRAHSNFAEYVPLALILIAFLEAQGYNKLWVHALCMILICGRSIHAYGISQVQENYRLRVLGMILTLSVLISVSSRILLSYL